MSTKYGMFIAAIMAMAESSPMAEYFSFGMSQDKCSINEITEKTNVTKEEVLELLKKGIIKGKIIFGVPYIIDDTPYSIKKKLEDLKEAK